MFLASGNDNIFGASAASVDDFLHDGVATATNGKPMAVAASNVVPIQDGATIALSDPKDTAIFAKTGGPFDTLFNHIFKKIDEIYSVAKATSILPQITDMQVMPSEPIGKNPMYANSMDSINVYRHLLEQWRNNGTNIESSKMQPIDVNIHGDIKLNCDGRIHDISTMLERDPWFIRNITDLITQQLSTNFGGVRRIGGINRPVL